MSPYAPRKIIVSIEDDAPSDDVADTTADITNEKEVPAETDIAKKTIDEDNELEELSGSMESMINDSNTLLKLQNNMYEAIAKKGMSADSAKIAAISLESIYARLNLKDNKIIPSMEHFSIERTRMSATKVALETVGEWLKKTWSNIYAGFAKIWEWIKNFVIHMFNNFNTVNLALEEYEKKINELPDQTDKTFTNTNLFSFFYVNKECNIKTVEKLVNTTVDMNGFMSRYIMLLSSNINQLERKVKQNDPDMLTAFEDIEAKRLAFLTREIDLLDKYSEGGHGDGIIAIGPFVGQLWINIIISNHIIAAPIARFDPNDFNRNQPDKHICKVLTKVEGRKLMNLVNKLVDSGENLQDMTKIIKALETQYASINDIVIHNATSYEGRTEEGLETPEQRNKVIHFLTNNLSIIIRTLSTMITAMLKFTFNTKRHALIYIKESLNNM